MAEDEGITVKKSENFSEWYNQVVLKAELADFSPVKGCMVIRPYGYAIWENIRDFLDRRIKETGHKNAYFPLFIPESFFKKEAEHVEGFSPEVAWVTHGGNTKLNERLAIRPTSETIINYMYSQWIRSYRDLPLLINQWANIVRWETKMTKLFMRTREFLWQEGHTCHRTKEEADEEVLKMLDVYREVYEDLLAIPVIPGYKTEKEKFAGALYTTTVEALMPDGRAIQGGTSHNLGQNFAKVFDITFIDKDEKKKYVWQTSWGLTTRTVAALVMTHGDDKGLVLPPKVAPIKIVIVPIIFEKHREAVLKKSKELKDIIEKRYSTVLDDREEYTAGYKFNYWELRGVPIRIEIGPKDLENKQVVLVRRDSGEKKNVKWDLLLDEIEKLLDSIQKNLYNRARNFLENNTVEVDNYEDLKKAIKERKMVKIKFCCSEECEEKIKEDTGATSACIPFEEFEAGKCVVCGKETGKMVYFAKHY
ncbi:MAG TPA: proline--tRNA ligase [Methanomicrobia archaeon]|nr:proline--tRNA ligase [Methanomicrobia archaeon]